MHIRQNNIRKFPATSDFTTQQSVELPSHAPDVHAISSTSETLARIGG